MIWVIWIERRIGILNDLFHLSLWYFFWTFKIQFSKFKVPHQVLSRYLWLVGRCKSNSWPRLIQWWELIKEKKLDLAFFLVEILFAFFFLGQDRIFFLFSYSRSCFLYNFNKLAKWFALSIRASWSQYKMISLIMIYDGPFKLIFTNVCILIKYINFR